MQIEYSRKAVADLDSLSIDDQTRIIEKIGFFGKQNNPLLFAKKLVGMSLYRFRIGNYRILFTTENKIIYVVTIKRRDKAYRDIGLD